MPTDEVCGVQGCGKEAKRSLSTKKVKEVLPELKLIGEPRRVHLRKEHYKQFREKTKQKRELDPAAWQKPAVASIADEFSDPGPLLAPAVEADRIERRELEAVY